MLQTFKNAWKIEELKKKIIFTMVVLVIFRLGCAIPVPFIQPSAISAMIAADSGNMLNYLNMISGGAFANATLFALGVTPYINSSIIITLLTVAIPYLENLSKEGEEGRKKIAKITRYIAVVIAFILSLGYYFVLKRNNALIYTEGMTGFFAAAVIITAFIAGSMLIMWMGEQIDKKGIGNGISLIISVNIIHALPGAFAVAWKTCVMTGDGLEINPLGSLKMVALILFMILVVALVVTITQAQRRIPVQQAKRMVGRGKVMNGSTQYLPLKLNYSGVMPVIFATAILALPQMLVQQMFSQDSWVHAVVANWLSPNDFPYYIISAIMIYFFSYFWVATMFQPQQISEDLKRSGG